MTVQSDSSCAGYLKGRLSPGGGWGGEGEQSGGKGSKEGGTKVNSVGFQGGHPILDT